jgi:hypothetical protein
MVAGFERGSSNMWLLVGLAIGAGLACWWMKHLFDQGWVRSKWYDEYVDRIEKAAASGEFVAGRFP